MSDQSVSVIIPTHNGATRGFLAHAIESVLSQTHQHFELFVVDDGSTDDTRSLCQDYAADGRLTYLHQRNRGPAAARNTGLEASHGEYVCFLDDDDVWYPDKLEKSLQFLRQCRDNDPKTGLIYHASDEIDSEGRKLGIRYEPANGHVFVRLLRGCFIGLPSSVMIPKNVLRVVGFFEEGKPYGVEDYDLWLRIAKRYHVYSLPEPLGGYRIHESGNLSDRRRMHEIGVIGVLSRALENEPYIPQHEIFGHWYRSYAMWHFREGDYYNCRRCHTIAAFYDRVGWRHRLAYWAAHFPRLVRFLERRFPRFVDRFRRGKKMA